MSVEAVLEKRSHAKCELCDSTNSLEVFEVGGSEAQDVSDPNRHALLCVDCIGQLNDPGSVDINHWRCLNQSIWSEVPAVKVLAWRQLNALARSHGQDWARDLLEQMYLEDEDLAWAKTPLAGTSDRDPGKPTLDSNGATLEAGDAVTLIKDLVVKGANFTAKRGTMVKGISLTDDPANIEGRVNGTRIVLKTCFLKKV